MDHASKFFVSLVILHFFGSVLSAPHCAIGHPKFKDNPNGFVYGIPASGYCVKSGKRVQVQYIIPVDNVNAPPLTADKKNIYSLGLYPSTKFTAELIPLSEYAKKYNLPSYVRYLFVNSENISCNKN